MLKVVVGRSAIQKLETIRETKSKNISTAATFLPVKLHGDFLVYEEE
jgi:hypothetical protein